MSGTGQPRIGFACFWGSDPEHYWNSAPWSLRDGMRHAADVVDVGVRFPRLPRTVLKGLHVRRRAGRLTSAWEYSRLTDAYTARALRRGISSAEAGGSLDAVLMVQDLARPSVPYFTYQDLSYDALIAVSGDVPDWAALLPITPATMARRGERQRAIYDGAAGVIAMSHWFARTLVEQTGIPAAKVHVVHPGRLSRAQSPAAPAAGRTEGAQHPGEPRERPAPRRRLLFVGRDFRRKGGDIVVAALSRLRRDYDPEISLTIAGPATWPLADAIPEGVRFLGSLSHSEVALLYDKHDLLVMPSRMEPFGIVFTEAIARGMPCVARDAYAMPEIVVPGVSGALVKGDDVDELTTAITEVLADEQLYRRCLEIAPTTAAHYSWERTGREIVEVMYASLGHERHDASSA